MEMYGKISRGDFRCPYWFPSDAKKLLLRMLEPNPTARITVVKLAENPWFREGYRAIDQHQAKMKRDESFGVVVQAFADEEGQDSVDDSKRKSFSEGPSRSSSPVRRDRLNAFDLIARSPSFDLSGLFEEDTYQGTRAAEAPFTTQKPTEAIVSKLEEIARAERFRVRKEKEGVVKLEGSREGRKGQHAVEAELTPALYVVELQKAAGHSLEYQRFYHQGMKPSLNDIVWKWQVGDQRPPPQAPSPADAKHD